MRKQKRMREPTPNETLIGIRESRGLTQAEMAITCNIGLRTYQMWEKGEILSPREHTLTGLYRLTGKTTPEELGFQRVQLASIAVPAANRLVPAAAAILHGRVPSFLTAFLPANPLGVRVSQFEIERLRTRADLLVGMCDQWGGASVQETALIESMRQASVMLTGRYATADRRTRAAEEIAGMSLAVGAMLADQGSHANAQTTLLVGLVATRDAGVARGNLRARILAQLVRYSLDRRDLPVALGLLDLADAVAETHRLPVDIVALLTALRAGVTGPLGQLKDALVFAAKAQDLHASAVAPTVSAADVAYEAGFGLACLELCVGLDIDNATAVFDRAIDAYAPMQVRKRALASTFRMLALTERGDGAAALHASAELTPVVDSLHSVQIRESMALAHLLPRVIRLDPEATAVSTALHAYPAHLPRAFLRTRPDPVEVATALQHAG